MSKIKHGMCKTKIYDSWRAMKRRCFNKNCEKYKDYGARGITVCDRWLGENGFINFYADMGKRPENKTLDRIDNNGNYCKSNCKWSSSKQQNNNSRRNHFLTYRGKTQTIAQWSRELNMSYSAIKTRLKKKWSVKKTLGIVVRHKKPNNS